MKRHNNVLGTLVPAAFFSRLVIIGVTLEFGLGQLLSPYIGGGSLTLNIFTFILSSLITFSILGSFFFLLRNHLIEVHLRFALVILLPISAALGGFISAAIRRDLGLDSTNLLTFRVLSAVVHITSITLILWFASSSLHLHNQRLQSLNVERNKLEVLNNKVKKDLNSLNYEVIESVRSRILKDLDQIKTLDAHETLNALIAVLEQTVRPISRQLESAIPQWTFRQEDRRTAEQINWRAALVEGTNILFLKPIGILTTLAVIATPMNFVRVGPSFAVSFIALTFLVGLPIFIGIKRLLTAYLSRSGSINSALMFVTFCLISGLAWGGTTLIITSNTPRPFRFLILCPFFTLLFAYVFGIAIAARNQAISIEETLMKITYELKWKIARKREQHRQQEKALAHALHGRVQATLTAAILELSNQLKNAEISHDQLMKVRSRISDVIEELNFREREPLQLPLVLEKVQATWSGVANIAMPIDSQLESFLSSDSQVLMTLNDVIPELVFNSIKHGQAKNIEICSEFEGTRTLSLIVKDDGKGLISNSEKGMGSGLLDTCATSWSRSRLGSLTVTKLLIPIR